MKIGVVCGLKSEAAALGAPPGVLVGISGARPDKAEAEARRLVSNGAELLVSFGLAGALDPDRKPGDLLVPRTVLYPDGRQGETDAGYSDALSTALSCADAPILGVDAVVASAGDKARLFQRHAAAAVDMESHRVSDVAERAGRPVLVVRAIADPADRSLPESANAAIGPDGEVRLWATLMGLMRRPHELPALMKLGADSKAAHASLRLAATALWRAVQP